jgi:hypothetical protein
VVHLTWGGNEFASIVQASNTTLAQQVSFVQHYVEQRGDRAGEILTQLGTLTDFFTAIIGIPTGRASYLVELLSLTQEIAGMCAMPAKHMLACRRPDELDCRLMPLVPTPAHGSQPSGHATQAIAMATVLNTLLREMESNNKAKPTKRQILVEAQAHRIAVNRTVAGLHYPMDSWAGTVIGHGVGAIIASLGQVAKEGEKPVEHKLAVLRADSNNIDYETPDIYDEKGDFFLKDLKKVLGEGKLDKHQSVHAVLVPDTKEESVHLEFNDTNDNFIWLWNKAREDLKNLTGLS